MPAEVSGPIRADKCWFGGGSVQEIEAAREEQAAGIRATEQGVEAASAAARNEAENAARAAHQVALDQAMTKADAELAAARAEASEQLETLGVRLQEATDRAATLWNEKGAEVARADKADAAYTEAMDKIARLEAEKA